MRKRRYAGWILLAAVGIFGAGVARSDTTYYVRTDGSDSQCNGRFDAPATSAPNCAYASPLRASDAVSGPGDAVLIRAGTYTTCASRTFTFGTVSVMFGLNNVDGTASRRITVRGLGDGQIVFDPPGSSCNHAVLVNLSDHVTIGGTGANHGFVVRDGARPNYNGGNPHGAVSSRMSSDARVYGITIESNTTVDCSQTSTAGIWVSGLQNVEVAHNRVEMHCDYYGIFVSDGQGCGASGPLSPGCPDRNGSIHDNHVEETRTGRRHYAYYSRGCGACSFYDNYAALGPDCTMDSVGYYLRDTRDHRVFNNYFYVRGGKGILIHDYNMSSAGVNERHRIYNNTIHGSGDRCLAQNSSCTGCEVRNNICSGIDGSNQWDIGIDCSQANGGGGWGHNQFHNIRMNRWYGASSPYTCSVCSQVTCDPNDANLYQADPGFSSSGTLPVPRLRLGAASPGIGQGSLDADSPTIDYDGESRGSQIDVGADERDGGPPPDPVSDVNGVHRTDAK